jgi:hypothetical protein
MRHNGKTVENAHADPHAKPEWKQSALRSMEGWAERTGKMIGRTLRRAPVVGLVVTSGAVLVAADAFGIGEVVLACVAGYVAYRALTRTRDKHVEVVSSEPPPHGRKVVS